MGLLNLFYTKRVNDEVFGDLEYRIQLFERNLWIGSVDFEPVGHRIRVFLYGDRSGPNEKQRAFYLELKDRYGESPEEYFNHLYDTFDMVHGRLPEEFTDPQNLKDHSELVSVTVPAFVSSDDEWNLCYSGIWQERYFLHFHGWTFSYGVYDD